MGVNISTRWDDMIHVKKKFIFFFLKTTLKKRIIFLLLFSYLVPFVFSIFLLFLSIQSILVNKIQKDMKSDLNQELMILENTFNNLDHLSQLLSFQGIVGHKLHQYLNSDNTYKQVRLTQQIQKDLNVIAFTNPNVGL